jgi:hypothetical protein
LLLSVLLDRLAVHLTSVLVILFFLVVVVDDGFIATATADHATQVLGAIHL